MADFILPKRHILKSKSLIGTREQKGVCEANTGAHAEGITERSAVTLSLRPKTEVQLNLRFSFISSQNLLKSRIFIT